MAKRINITVKDELYNDVSAYCESIGISFSAFVAISINERMATEKMIHALGKNLDGSNLERSLNGNKEK